MGFYRTESTFIDKLRVSGYSISISLVCPINRIYVGNFLLLENLWSVSPFSLNLFQCGIPLSIQSVLQQPEMAPVIRFVLNKKHSKNSLNVA